MKRCPSHRLFGRACGWSVQMMQYADPHLTRRPILQRRLHISAEMVGIMPGSVSKLERPRGYIQAARAPSCLVRIPTMCASSFDWTVIRRIQPASPAIAQSPRPTSRAAVASPFATAARRIRPTPARGRSTLCRTCSDRARSRPCPSAPPRTGPTAPGASPDPRPGASPRLCGLSPDPR